MSISAQWGYGHGSSVTPPLQPPCHHAACRQYCAECRHRLAVCQRHAACHHHAACCHCAAARRMPLPRWCASLAARVAEDHDGNHQERTKLCRLGNAVTSTRRVPQPMPLYMPQPPTAAYCCQPPALAATAAVQLALRECQEILLSDGLGVHEANWMLGVLFSRPINSLHAIQFDKKYYSKCSY